ncbi:phosphatidylinositol N-acetylglucosaminyltransferase subunit Q-like [Saccoglossus kowalevskii]|uniref:Phosphatidylinositol N-acetylglucosaminyltransferase subunit Q-like n=1 Tax=Saccoglossus kowalevskii TaxID=10224 RepID=A0ABM0LWD7_SACKO|nr:PREDICTED: phosphatidylinositol N-acetylglucosaminyltransferase subunit Q-like [Saccoglossus kowalevskii]
MEVSNVIRVLFPFSCVISEDGILIGCQDSRRRLVCVVGVVNQPCSNETVRTYLRKVSLGQKTTYPVTVLGTWRRGQHHDDTAYRANSFPAHGQDNWIEMYTYVNNPDPPNCIAYGTWENNALMMILYDQTKFLKAKLQNQEGNSGIANGKTKKNEYMTDIDCIFDMVNSCKNTVLCSGHNAIEYDLNIIHSQSERNKSCKIWTLSLSLLNWWMMLIFSVIVKMTGIITMCSLCVSNPIQRLVRFPATGCQLVERYHHLYHILTLHKQSDHEELYQRTSSKLYIRKGNMLSSIVVDILLGVAVMLWLIHYDYPNLLASQIMQLVDVIGGELQKLLAWMMGVPAGLKLNSQLDMFLGKFFLYHVYLWLGYLHVLRPFMSTIVWCIGLSGCLGLSVFLSLMMDFLSMLTFHIYCFYVYAARLYNLQLAGLSSCWRLFRGKKWNVLRQRVDSCQYDVDQLFVGTLMFTILLFLLPTTALYYVVFTSFRLVVLVLESLLAKMVVYLTTFPVFSLFLRLIQSDILAGGVRFSVIDGPSNQPLCLSIHVEPTPYSVVLKQGKLEKMDTWKTNNVQKQSSSLGSICKKLLAGHLVYPWGGEKPKK